MTRSSRFTHRVWTLSGIVIVVTALFLAGAVLPAFGQTRAQLEMLQRNPELVRQQIQRFLDSLAHERRSSAHTVRAYGRDLEEFLTFAEGRLERGLAMLDTCEAGDVDRLLAHWDKLNAEYGRGIDTLRAIKSWPLSN